MSKKYLDLLTVFKKEETGFLYVKPNLGKYGVKKITVTTNEGETIELDKTSFLPLNDPREAVKKFEKDEGKAEQRIAKMDEIGISKVVTLVHGA